jgi:2-amino-4-hydroxy-6-hydroxymethyldihydropteridine diphosphokinase
MQHQALLALGSNLGERSENLQKALALLGENAQISICKVSGFYETSPVGMRPNDPAMPFINAAVWVKTDMTPLELLRFCLTIEQTFGRNRDMLEEKQGYSSRSIDLDILFFDELILQNPELDLPHPRLQERAFVLVPLAEIASDWEHPVLKQPISQLLANLDTIEQVTLLSEPILA